MPKIEANFTYKTLGDGKVQFSCPISNVNYSWDFGDGNKSAEQNPSNLYLKNGNYNVTLVISNNKSQDSKTQALTIVDAPKPTGNFSFTNQGNGKILFKTDALKVDSYLWNFGDGESSTEKEIEHLYKLNGTYQVQLTLTNSNGKTELKQEVKVNDSPKPIAKFSFNNIGDGKISFSNESENADSFKWDFGDGSTSTDKSPQHTYAKNGDFKITLDAVNKNGTTSFQKTITISNVIVTFEHIIENQSNYPIIVYNDDKNNVAHNFPETTVSAKSKVTIKLKVSESINLSIKSNDNALQLEHSATGNRTYVVDAYKFLFEIKFTGDCKPIKIVYSSENNTDTLNNIPLSYLLQIKTFGLDFFEVQGFKNNVNGILTLELKYKEKIVRIDNVSTPFGNIKMKFNRKSNNTEIIKYNPDEWPCGVYNGHLLSTGPKGGCYYINNNNNKTYVDRGLCSCD
ncbi:hypothetical protein GCM10027442_41070 [Emticicia fontis]